MKLLLGMPPELLAAWEAKHPAKWSIGHIAKNYVWRARLSFVLCIAWFFPIVIGVLFITQITQNHGLGILITVLGAALAFAGAALIKSFLFPEREWDAILEPLETALNDEELNITACLCAGFDMKRIKEYAYSCLRTVARDVITAEEYFSRVRKEDHVSVTAVIKAGQDLIRWDSSFDRTLNLAVEFGLSDGKRRKYFQEAFGKMS